MYNHGGVWDISKKQGRLQGPGFPWAQVSRRLVPPAALFCFNSKKCVLRVTDTAHYLLSSIPTVHCGAAAWCRAAGGTDWSGLKEEWKVGMLNELLHGSQNRRLGWRIAFQQDNVSEHTTHIQRCHRDNAEWTWAKVWRPENPTLHSWEDLQSRTQTFPQIQVGKAGVTSQRL